MQLQTISVKELRTNMPKIIKALEKGADYTLIYRSKAIAYIKPINNKPRKYKNLLNPPKGLIFHSNVSAVELVRRERDEKFQKEARKFAQTQTPKSFLS